LGAHALLSQSNNIVGTHVSLFLYHTYVLQIGFGTQILINCRRTLIPTEPTLDSWHRHESLRHCHGDEPSLMHLAVKSCFLHAKTIFPAALTEILISDARGKSITLASSLSVLLRPQAQEETTAEIMASGTALSANWTALVTKCTDFLPQNNRRYLGAEISL